MTAKPFDIVVLSSSPPAPSPAAIRHAETLSYIASSPSRQQLPAPRAISSFAFSPPPELREASKRKPTALVSSSKAVAIPEAAVKGFMSARSLIGELGDTEGGGSSDGGVENKDGQEKDKGKTREAAKPRKKREKKSEVLVIEDSEGPEEILEPPPKPKSRARKKKEGDAPPKRSRKKKKEEEETSPIYVASAHFCAPVATGNGDAADAQCGEGTLAASEVRPKEAKVPKPRKPRAKKADKVERESAAAPKKARVTKPKAEKTKRKSIEVVSAHFQKKAIDQAPNKAPMPVVHHPPVLHTITENSSIWDVPSSPSSKDSCPPKHGPPDNVDEPLELDQAVARRCQWTPPRDTEVQPVQPGSSSKENTPAIVEANTNGLTGLLSGFSYAHGPLASDATTSITAESRTLTKRRRVELIDVPSNAASRQSSPEKGKAPKKKARTITDLVTEQYATKAAEPESEPLAIMSNFFSPRTTATTTKLPLNDKTNAPTVKVTRKNVTTAKRNSENGDEKKKPRAKASKPAAKSAKPKLVMEKLLSPSSAVLKMSRQDILFGTSSQLALEESPSTVRQIQHAILESEKHAALFHGFSDDDNALPKPWRRLTKTEGRRGLWNASSRDEAGDLLEKQSDVHIPEPDRTQDIPLLIDGSNDDASSPFVNIDDLPPLVSKAPIMQLSSDLPTPPDTLPDEPVAVNADDDNSFTHIDDFLQEPPPSNQNAEPGFAHIDDFPPSAQHTSYSPPRALPGSYSTGSPTKRRGRPAKNVSAIPHIPASAPAAVRSTHLSKTKRPSTAAPSTPSRQRRFIDIEEILDSEDDEALSPTPPRRRRLNESPPLPLISLSTMTASDPRTTLLKSPPKPKPSNNGKAKDNPEEPIPVPVLRIPSSHLRFATIKPTLFSKITSLIRSLPPTTNPANPSWHEKILMYDPIVLEDLTTFLNGHAQMRTYRRATQKQVKAWNAHLKRSGKEQLAHIDDEGVGDGSDKEVLAVHKELEAWMVQKWCEDMSICCVLRDKHSRGGVRKCLY